MAKQEKVTLEESIQQELDNYYNDAAVNKQQTDYYVYITILVNFITAVIGLVKISFITNPALVVGLIAIGMAALTGLWRYAERKKRLRAQLINIRNTFADTALQNTIDSINQILTENGK